MDNNIRASLNERIAGLGGSSLPTRVVCQIIGNAQRQAVIDVLRSEEGSVSVRSLAEEVAALDPDTGTDRAEISLHHNHLPLLESADVIELDGDAVGAGSELDSVAASLDALRDILD